VSNNRIGETLEEQFDRVWQSLRDALAQFTDEQLAAAPEPWLAPVRQAFHVIDAVSAYTDPDPETWEQSELSRTWDTAPVEAFPGREELLAALDAVEAKAKGWLGSLTDEEWTRDQTKIPWAGSTSLDRALYALRHTQYHVALIHMELRRSGLPVPGWR
jgi:hypothetical protein